MRQSGRTYEAIGASLPYYGFNAMTKNGVKEVIRKTRPDLMGGLRRVNSQAKPDQG